MLDIENIFSDRPLKRQALSQWQTYKVLEGYPFAGTGTKMEMVELERHMREFIGTGLYSYMTMENHLISYGYDQKKIRCTFERLTGMTPEDFQNVNSYYSKSPSSIPRASVAWGLPKKKGEAGYFIQPWNLGYAIFCQVDDRTRNIVAEFDHRAEAIDGLSKYVKEVYTYNKPMDMKLKDPDLRFLNEPRVGIKTASFESDAAKELKANFDMMQDAMQPREKLAAITNAYNKGDMPENDYIALIKEAGFKLTADDKEEDGKDAPPEPGPVPQSEGTPSEFLQETSQQPTLPIISAAADEILNFITSINEKLVSQKVLVKGFKYVRKDGHKYSANLKMDEQKPEEFFNNDGLISLIIECSDSEKHANSAPRFGVAVFSVVENELVSSGEFKGQDERLYQLSADGIKEYLKSE